MELLTTRHQTILLLINEFMKLLPPDIKQSPSDTSIYGTFHHQTIPYNHINLWNSLPLDIKQSPSRHINLWNNFLPDIKQSSSQHINLWNTLPSDVNQSPPNTSIYGTLYHQTSNSTLQTHQFIALITTRHQFMESFAIRHQTIPSIHINLWKSLPYDIKQSPLNTSLYGNLYHPTSNNSPPDISIYGTLYHLTSNNQLPTHQFMKLLIIRHPTIPPNTPT